MGCHPACRPADVLEDGPPAELRWSLPSALGQVSVAGGRECLLALTGVWRGAERKMLTAGVLNLGHSPQVELILKAPTTELAVKWQRWHARIPALRLEGLMKGPYPPVAVSDWVGAYKPATRRTNSRFDVGLAEVRWVPR